MFCSKCGKTLPIDALQCPSCGERVGESRFEGSSYTAAQPHILPGQRSEGRIVKNAPPAQTYTRTNYTTMPADDDQTSADARTTYRPVYSASSSPEELRDEIRETLRADKGDKPAEPAETDEEPKLSEEARSAIDEMSAQLQPDESIDFSAFRANEIKSTPQAGISSGVQDLINELENEPQRKLGRHRQRVDYDAYDEVSTPAAPSDSAEAPANADEDAVFEDIDDEEFDELRHSGFNLAQVFKIAGALVVCAALIIGGVMWFRYINQNRSTTPIENVRETIYNDGIALLKQHADTASVSAILTDYTAAGNDLTSLVVKLDASANAIDALLPEEATENEQLFMSALQKIEGNIANSITSDALALGSSDANAVADSEKRWTVVNNSITMLESAKTASELTAIVNGEVIDVKEAAATPSPTPAPNYDTLSKGDKSDAVLEMQNRLYELGFLGNDGRDGAFGKNTQTAVKMFQQVAGLEITGIADSATLAAIYADDAPRTANAQPTATPAA